MNKSIVSSAFVLVFELLQASKSTIKKTEKQKKSERIVTIHSDTNILYMEIEHSVAFVIETGHCKHLLCFTLENKSLKLLLLKFRLNM